MEVTTISLILSTLAFLLAIAALGKASRAPKQVPAARDGFETTPLRLQAYERLVLLTERIALPNLISRLNQPDLSVQEMKIILMENIKQEFEYNHTQQLYVSPASWEAVRNLKEQSILFVHQVAATMPPGATAGDLNKRLIEILMAQPNEPLHVLVLQVLNSEAKKVMRD
jgi:hypothetical protein